jgi:hypothetical protein
MRRRRFLTAVLASGLAPFVVTRARAGTDGYLSWTPEQAQRIAKSTRKTGKVGSRFNERLLKTERAINYKLIATWMTPEVIRATARWLQLDKRLSDDRTRALVAEAESAGDTVFMIELDPHEGSGVIPSEWEAYLQARGSNPAAGTSVRGVSNPRLRDVAALNGIERRNYDYDRFWVVFPLTGEGATPIFGDGAVEAELITRVYSQEEHTYWPISEGIRARPR